MAFDNGQRSSPAPGPMAGLAGKVLIFVPTYEERDNVGPLLRELLEHAPGADILFIDDNSPDGTGILLDQLAKEHSSLKVIHRTAKLGIGGAHQAAVAYAYESGFEFLVTMDCDFTHSPSDIPRLIERSFQGDLAVGSRFLEGDSLPGWNPLRRVLTHLGHFLTVNMLGVHADATGAFRVYRLSRVPRELFALVRSTGYAFFFESLYVAQQNGLRVVEEPIKLPARTQGHSKMSAREILRSVHQLYQLGMASRRNPGQFRLPRTTTADRHERAAGGEHDTSGIPHTAGPSA